MPATNHDNSTVPRADAAEGAQEPIAIHAWVEGRVQGVSYRVSTQRMAVELGVAGWVKNLADGRVEIWAHGSPQSVEKLLAWLRVGPPGARVEGVRHRYQSRCDTPHDLHGFRIRPG